MAIAQTNTRVMAEFVGGVALQSALGSAATPSRYLNMERMVIAGNFVDLEYRFHIQSIVSQRGRINIA